MHSQLKQAVPGKYEVVEPAGTDSLLFTGPSWKYIPLCKSISEVRLMHEAQLHSCKPAQRKTNRLLQQEDSAT